MAEQQKPRMVGGMGNVQSAEGNADVKGFLDQVRAEAEAAAGRTFTSLEAVEFATQLVNGTNYFIKASTGDGNFVFIRLHKPIKEDTVSFHSIKVDKTETDVLVYF